MVAKKFLTKEEALQKAKQYCAYQERSHYEVSQKLWELGIWRNEKDEILAQLIEENYLNEERFANMFAGGKFRLKSWGRKKIGQALKEKKVSDYNIRKALESIGEEEYEATLERLASKKYESLRPEQYLVRKKKTIDYLIQKGYEPALVLRKLEQLIKDG